MNRARDKGTKLGEHAEQEDQLCYGKERIYPLFIAREVHTLRLKEGSLVMI